MSLLYSFSKYNHYYDSILIPFSLQIFLTLQRQADGLHPCYGKWFAIFVLTFIFNGLTVFNSNLITFIDLMLKIGVVFIPQSLVRDVLDRMRLSRIRQEMVKLCKIVNYIFKGYSNLTFYILNNLRIEESQQFRDAMINNLKQNNIDQKVYLNAKQTAVTHTASSCEILNQKMFNEIIMSFEGKLRTMQFQKEELAKKKKDLEKKFVSQSAYKTQRQKEIIPQNEKPSKNIAQIKLEKSKTMTENFGLSQRFKESNRPKIYSPPSNSIQQLSQSREFLPEDFEEQGSVRQSRQSKKVEIKKIERKRESLIKEDQSFLKRRNTLMQGQLSTNVVSRERTFSPNASSIKQQPAKMLQKLDVSVSQYSGMFDEQDQDQESTSKTLISKVQAIVEIGSASNSRLEIYNLQLYSNSDLRIMSLYDRQFEKHRLISMKKGQSAYFILNVTGTPNISRRKVKFRGQYQAFLKYLKKQSILE